MKSDPIGVEKSSVSQRVAILAPTPQDAHVCGKILGDVEIEVDFCQSIDEFCKIIAAGEGAALIAQEHLSGDAIDRVKRVLDQQPAWSDFPVIVLLTLGEQSAQTIERLLSLGHVTLLTRPLRVAVFVNTLRARLRDRSRQYAVRDLLRERENTTEKSRRDARRVKMALRAGGMGAWEWSHDHVFWSRKMFDLLGYPLHTQPSTQAVLDRVHPDDLDELLEKWHAATEQGDNFQHEFRIEHPKLGERWLASIGEVVSSKSGKTRRFAGINWDITEQREFERSLQDARLQAEVANRSKSEFLANMSHEIRTPMTAIIGYVDLIAESIHDEQTLDYIRTIRTNGSFLLDIINDILDLSKIEAGKFDVLPEQFAPNRLVEDVWSIMGVRAKESNIELEVEYEGLIPSRIETDPKRLKQILINLVGNAIKFTDRGCVRLQVRFDVAGDGKMHFDVIDTGIGMTPRQIEKLFQPFSQADTTVARTFGGTGLGLAISKRLAKMLGGEISVVSESGKGSRFSVTIDPGDIRNATLMQPSLTTHPINYDAFKQPDSLQCRVLIVDDRRDIRFLSKRILVKAGASVTEAEDGQDAVEQVQEMLRNDRLVDLVLLDMQMPRLDGYRTAEQLRRMGFQKPIIALTADAMQGDMTRCIECGCNGYLSKPIDAEMLVEKVRELTQS
ncbi:Autoinducer 2 sensor kinase/phosphatase LuxQ [Novipirellula galeiformis]|uniref:histidine kinase n=1 Tax=Novipirellula galeiformis TaxID=2528004 RepID=A0A5C6C069_9BACT|nr:ATP-binding protein [Novipirellula galeiformis]TWU17575.1 Autoinducer 2 sensor kinase/phosphatase LuxQ [Novipirellula galeiformis]